LRRSGAIVPAGGQTAAVALKSLQRPI
jgi:hypothetical protein